MKLDMRCIAQNKSLEQNHVLKEELSYNVMIYFNSLEQWIS